MDSVVLSGERSSCYQAQISIVLLGVKCRAIRRTECKKIEEIHRVFKPLNDLTLWILFL